MAGEKEEQIQNGPESAETEASGWDVDGGLTEGEQIEHPADEDGESTPIPVKKPEKAKEPTEEEGQEPEPVEGEEKEPSEEEEGQVDLESIQQESTALKAQVEHLTKLVNWQQEKLNAKSPQLQPDAREKDAKAKGTQAQEGDQNALETPPEAWEDTQSVVQFFDKRQDLRTRNTMKDAYTEYVQPEFERMNNAIHSLIDRVVKPQLTDYDGVMKDVYNELFVMDPTGQNIVGYRNEALLEYFKAQAIPILAMYDYGLSKKAPNKIAEGIKKGTKENLTKITKRPKAPTEIKGRKVSDSGADNLDWDTPKDQVEKHLEKHGLL